LGLEHPHTVDTRTRYAHLLRACGRTVEADALEAVSTKQAATGDDEPLRLRPWHSADARRFRKYYLL